MNKKIRGRIIRIVDDITVVINLGWARGVTDDSIFSILGAEEKIIDPETEETLGTLSIVKGRVKASAVYENFSIAISKWTSSYSRVKVSGMETFLESIIKVESIVHDKTHVRALSSVSGSISGAMSNHTHSEKAAR